MYDVMHVQLIECLGDALHDGHPFGLAQLTFDFEEVVELSAGAVLKEKIDVGVVVEAAIQLEYVDMVEVALDFDFPRQLLAEILAPYRRFLDDLDGQDQT